MLLLPDFDVFYDVCACRACVDSYLIDSSSDAWSSVCPWVDLSLGYLCVGLLAGGSPAATHFLLLRQKKVSKEKATRLSGSLRFASGNLRCPEKTGVGANSLHCAALKQRAALIPFFRGITGPNRTGQTGNEVRTAEQPNSHRAQALAQALNAISSIAASAYADCARDTFYEKEGHRIASTFPVLLLPPLGEGGDEGLPESAPVPAPASPVLTGPVMSGKSGIRAARCLSRRRVCADPRFCRPSQVARSEAQGPRQPGRLFFAYFLLAKQKKVSCRRATPGQQALAKLAKNKSAAKRPAGARP
jgi:hypothetical protein